MAILGLRPVPSLRTDPALLASTRVGLDQVGGVHTDVEAETQGNAPRLHLRQVQSVSEYIHV